MKRRADTHDYTERRMYMITIEVEGRRSVFGHIEGNLDAPKESLMAPHIVLSPLGKVVQDEWLGISKYYPQIEVMAIQMMPDHLHGILFVKDRLPVHLGKVISGFKAGCRKAMRTVAQLTSAENPSQLVTALPTSDSNYKPLFARGYNDLILRSYEELGNWKNYLQENPRRLMMKRSNPEFLRPFWGLQIGDFTFNGIGNRALLQAPRRLAVRISRRLVGEELERTVLQFINEARQGAVLVSPAISPGEKRIMREAFDAGLPTIVIVENGFTQLSKPRGEQFYACSEGRLLMLSAWEHHNEKRKITAYQCVQMNLMALAVSNKR